MQQANSKDAIASRLAQPITEVLSTYIQQKLNAVPRIEDLRHIWECTWEDRAGEISIFLHSDSASDYCLKLFYIWKINTLPEATLQPADINTLSRLLEERTGLRVVTRA